MAPRPRQRSTWVASPWSQVSSPMRRSWRATPCPAGLQARRRRRVCTCDRGRVVARRPGRPDRAGGSVASACSQASCPMAVHRAGYSSQPPRRPAGRRRLHGRSRGRRGRLSARVGLAARPRRGLHLLSVVEPSPVPSRCRSDRASGNSRRPSAPTWSPRSIAPDRGRRRARRDLPVRSSTATPTTSSPGSREGARPVDLRLARPRTDRGGHARDTLRPASCARRTVPVLVISHGARGGLAALRARAGRPEPRSDSLQYRFSTVRRCARELRKLDSARLRRIDGASSERVCDHSSSSTSEGFTDGRQFFQYAGITAERHADRLWHRGHHDRPERTRPCRHRARSRADRQQADSSHPRPQLP